MICILKIFLKHSVRLEIMKNLQNSKSKIGCKIVIFQPKILIFSVCLDIFTLDLTVFEFLQNLYPFLSYSQETKIFGFLTITQERIKIF